MTDVNVQYFSHLNGLALGNNWGDLIRLLDTCLVNGLVLPAITNATITISGDLQLTFFAAHNAMLFQIVELTGFDALNGKYRVKGAPTATQLILKAELTGQTITTTGSAKLASLGYEIIFRDTNDVKRVYRAIDPTAQHPFIRVDETISDGVNSYTSTYAKYAMVGLLENMTHIDDYENPDVLQLPMDTADLKKNWKITGTSTSVVRGWSRWYWAKGWGNLADSASPVAGSRNFSLSGDKDAFYILRAVDFSNQNFKTLIACGMFNGNVDGNIIPSWFLVSKNLSNSAGTIYYHNDMPDGSPLMRSDAYGGFYLTKNGATKIANTVLGRGIVPDHASGFSDKFAASNVAAVTIPIFDADAHLRGTLKHICYAGNARALTTTTPLLANKSMYVCDTAYTFTNSDRVGAFNFYLGELE